MNNHYIHWSKTERRKHLYVEISETKKTEPMNSKPAYHTSQVLHHSVRGILLETKHLIIKFSKIV